MELFRSALICCLFLFPLSVEAACSEAARHHIIQQVCNGNDSGAIALYRQHCPTPDYPLLREIGFAVLERDARSSEATVQRLALFGIALTADEHAVAFFHEALCSQSPEIQLYALQQLCRYHDAGAEAALRRAMSSPYALMRLEAALLMAQGRFNSALSHVESLMQKCPEELQFIFPEMLIEIGSEGAFQILRKQLMSPCQMVRLAAIHAIAKRSLERFAPYIRTLASQHDNAQLEGCAYALAALKDHQGVPLLTKMTSCSFVETQLAAQLALYKLGYPACKNKIIEIALKGNTFAIQVLPELDNQEELLFQIIQRGDSTIRANATIALLATKDKRAPGLMLEYLSPTSPQPPLVKVYSPGKSLFSYRGAPLRAYDTPLWETAHELALVQKEQWLEECYACGEAPFLELANALIARRQNDLMPALFQLLGKSYTEATEKFVENCSKLPGYPLARNYALMTMLSKGEKEACYGPLKDWVKQQWQNDLSNFRPKLSKLDNFDNDCFQTELKPTETAKLFLDGLNVLIADQNHESISLLLEGLESSHRSLHSIFAALLVRLSQ